MPKKISPRKSIAGPSAGQNRLRLFRWSRRLRHRLVLPGAIAGICLAAAAVIVFWPAAGPSPRASYAGSFTRCTAAAQQSFDCYREELGAMVAQHSPQKAFAELKGQYEKVPYVKAQCHQLAHVIGRAALDRYKELADAFGQGDHFCWAGYHHGALEEYSANKGFDYIIRNANQVCKKLADEEKFSFNHYNCVHGLGHGFMEVQQGELFSALRSCDSIKNDWERESCYGGVFMQNIMEAEKYPDRPPKFLKTDQPMYPCTAVDRQYKGQCYLMQTSYALKVLNGNFTAVFTACDGLSDTSYKATCYQSLGRDASGRSVSDVEQTKTACLLGVSLEAQINCVIGAAKDFISYFHSDQQVKELCAALPEGPLRTECVQTAENYYKSF